MPTAIEFGHFQIQPHRHEVLAEGRPMEFGEASVRDAWGGVARPCSPDHCNCAFRRVTVKGSNLSVRSWLGGWPISALSGTHCQLKPSWYALRVGGGGLGI
jgi:hypothetical protein